jgi:hypothetical protein
MKLMMHGVFNLHAVLEERGIRDVEESYKERS